MPVTAQAAQGITEGLGGIVKLIAGSSQKKKANKLLSGLQYPNEQIPSEITAAAATGLPSEQYNQGMQNIQRQQLIALRGAHDRRGGLGLISGIQQGTNDADLNLDVKNAQARQQNQFRLAGWKDKVWQNNIKDKYNRDYNYAMGLLGQGNQNVYGGADQALAGAGTALTGSLLGSSGSGQIQRTPNTGPFNWTG